MEMAAASTSNPSCIVEVGQEYPNPNPNPNPYPYPYPSHFAPNFVSVKLSGKDTYSVWNRQMLCLLRSHGMLGFINGKIVSPRGYGKEGHMEAWIRSDSLVQGWILGSLSEPAAIKVVTRLTSKHNKTYFTAKDAWDELQRTYGSPIQQAREEEEIMIRGGDLVTEHNSESEDREKQNEKTEVSSYSERKKKTKREQLYRCIVEGDKDTVTLMLRDIGLTTTDKITNNGDTSLHVAVGSSTKNTEMLEYLLGMILPENTKESLDVRNLDGSTPLHVAAIVGNTKAAKILLEKNRELLFADDKEGHTPLAISLSNMHTQTSRCLLKHIKKEEYCTLFSGTSGDELLVLAISSKEFGLAANMLMYCTTIHSDAVLMAISQNFPRDLNFWERIGDPYILMLPEETCFPISERADSLCHPWVARIVGIFVKGMFFWVYYFILAILQITVQQFAKRRIQIYNDTYYLLWLVLTKIRDSDIHTNSHYVTNPMFEATRQNAHKVVEHIVLHFPDSIWSTNEDGHNFIQYAVINRSEMIYSLLYQMSEHMNIYKTIKDSSGNNLLHLAARLAPPNKSNLISGAALQIQRELQWFKEVEGFVCPLNRIQKNSDDETPEVVFTKEHKDLVIDGEKWMKTTAESYTITAALITTIVFAAAITVPGGNNQDTGKPIFTNKTTFTIFAISDAISLFTAVTSLLMFLSILTARFNEQDFLFKLPKRLIIGLTALFISTTAMIIAFGATLFLVFGQNNSWILFPIGVLTCLPITSFVTLQFPLIVDLINATYVRSIFVKKWDGDGIFY